MRSVILDKKTSGDCYELYVAIKALNLHHRHEIAIPLKHLLLTALKKEQPLSELASQLLAEIGAPEVIRPLVECFGNDLSSEGVQRLKDNLRRVKLRWNETPEALAGIPALLDALHRHYRKSTAEGLKLLGWHAKTDCDCIAYAIATEDKQTVLGFGSAAVAPLIDALDKVLWFSVVEVLDELDALWVQSDLAKKQVPPLIERLAGLGNDRIADGNWVDCAGHRLSRLNDGRAVQPLLDALKEIDERNLGGWNAVYFKGRYCQNGIWGGAGVIEVARSGGCPSTWRNASSNVQVGRSAVGRPACSDYC